MSKEQYVCDRLQDCVYRNSEFPRLFMDEFLVKNDVQLFVWLRFLFHFISLSSLSNSVGRIALQQNFNIVEIILIEEKAMYISAPEGQILELWRKIMDKLSYIVIVNLISSPYTLREMYST